MTPFARSARAGVRIVITRPWLIAGLYALNLATTTALGLAAAPWLGRLFGQHPPTPWAWAVIIDASPSALVALALTLAAAVLAYGLVTAWPIAAVLARLANQPWKRALGRPARGILLLRAASGVVLGLCALGGGSAARWVYQRSLAIADERVIALALLGLSLPFLLVLVGCLAWSHYAQLVLIARHTSFRAALSQSLSLLRRFPWAAGALWATQWVAIVALTATPWLIDRGIASPVATSVAGQLAVVLKVAAALWAWGAGIALTRQDQPLGSKGHVVEAHEAPELRAAG